MLTIKHVLDAFDELGGNVNQPQALQAALEDKGWSASEVVDAVNSAIEAGELAWTEMRGLKKNTN